MFRKIYSNISIALIKQLREVSGINSLDQGSPINDCKKALESSEGNFDKAMLYLKERGLAQAEKRQGNTAKQGVIVAYTNSKVAALAEINCETDFVARTNEFLDFSQHLIKYLVSQNKELSNTNIDELLRQGVNQQYFETNIDDKRKQLIGKLQENIMIGNLNVFVAKDNGNNNTYSGVFGAYQHNCLKDTICGLAGSVVELIANQPLNDVGAQVMREGANNLAASYLGLKPRFIYEGEVTSEAIQQVKDEVLKEFSTKSPKQQEFILKGKLQGFYADNVFEHMEYVLDENECSIKEYIKNELESVTKSQVKIGRCLYLAI